MNDNSKNPPAPTETRPPLHEHPEMCPVCQSPYCEHEEAEQNLIKQAWESGYAARAAALEEPPKCKCIRQGRQFIANGLVICEYCGNPLPTVAAPEREPAPRPQCGVDFGYLKCLREKGHEGSHHSWQGIKWSHAAASSPAVRTQDGEK